MHVSFNQISEKTKDNSGFGYARKMCEQSLRTLGHRVSFADATADVEINFCSPGQAIWTGPYRIFYFPWESSLLAPGWVNFMNNTDEVWAPSPLNARWFSENGVTTPVRVYPHGVDRVWFRGAYKRSGTGRQEILHMGAEATRKGAMDAIEAFFNVLSFKDARLTMKMALTDFAPPPSDKVRVIANAMEFNNLVQLFHNTDLYVGPSYGEGFGLPALQAMASCAPVLLTQGVYPFGYLLDEHNLIKSVYKDSPWQKVHPGKMFWPDRDDFMDKLRYHYDNREVEAEKALCRVSQVLEDYDWVRLTKQAFSHLN